MNVKHIELAGEIAKVGCAVAGHRSRGERGAAQAMGILEAQMLTTKG